MGRSGNGMPVVDEIQDFHILNSSRASREKEPPTERTRDQADEALCKIKGHLNRRKTKMIDVFRVIDVSGDGFVSLDELGSGLVRLGLPMAAGELQALALRLDKDGSGDVNMREFDRALKAAERRARAEGWDHEVELDTFTGTAPTISPPPRYYDWSMRKVHTDKSDRYCKPSDTGMAWRSATAGPKHANMSAKVHCGSLQDSSVGRQRIFDVTSSTSAPPVLDPQAIVSGHLGNQRPVPPNFVYDGRFGRAPLNAVADMIHRDDRRHTGRHLCAASTRGVRPIFIGGGVRRFKNAFLSNVVVQQGALYMSEERAGATYDTMFDGSAGLSSRVADR